MSEQLLFLLHQRQHEFDNVEQQSNQQLIPTNSKNPQRALNTSMKRAPPRTSKQQPYVSPFVRKANEIAKQRAQLALRKLRSKSSRSDDGMNKPDMNFKVTSEYFDPKLRKQEIFKIEPKFKSRKEEQEGISNALPLKNKASGEVTRRTYGVCEINGSISILRYSVGNPSSKSILDEQA